ncbi:MAG: type IX secretion system protein PorQ [Chitinophagaceae bacterium]
MKIRLLTLGFALTFILPKTMLAQVTGGQHVFEFLNLAQSAHISALGGVNVCNPMEDVSLALQNPAQMRPSLHNQLSVGYNSYYAGVSIANLAYGYYAPKLNTAFILGIQYLNYGSFHGMDDIGNPTVDFKASDYFVSLGASKKYGERWRYGAALKLAYSNYATATATALLADVGILYTDTANLITFGATAKNIGFMTQQFEGSGSEPLPFDLQLGISKRFAHLPLRLMATVHHLYEWDIRYNNPADFVSNSLTGGSDSSSLTKKYFADKLFRHFILGAELSLGKRLTFGLSYNHLHRAELALPDKKGLAGFSFGASLNLNKFQVHYARSYYSIVGAYNEFGLAMNLNKLGMGKGDNFNAVWTEKEL